MGLDEGMIMSDGIEIGVVFMIGFLLPAHSLIDGRSDTPNCLNGSI